MRYSPPERIDPTRFLGDSSESSDCRLPPGIHFAYPVQAAPLDSADNAKVGNRRYLLFPRSQDSRLAIGRGFCVESKGW
jgi:hypothetical protein